VSVSDLYIPKIVPSIFLQQNRIVGNEVGDWLFPTYGNASEGTVQKKHESARTVSGRWRGGGKDDQRDTPY